MAKVNRYHATGFILLSQIVGDGLKTAKADAVSIAKGDVLHISSGYATNATTAFAYGLLGVAVAAVDNSGGSAGDLDVQYVPYQGPYRYIVAVEQNALVTQAAVGTLIDLQSVNTVDISDVVTAAPGFFVEEIDVSTDAVAANTYGFVIGHFELDS